MKNSQTVILVLAAVLLVIATAGASVYFTRQTPAAQEKVVEKTIIAQPAAVRVVQTQNAAPVPDCNDGNIAGKAVGGVSGGVIGSLAGKGNGKTAATIGGTLGGAYLGGKVLPLNNVTCK